LHVVTEQNGLPVSTVCSFADIHNSTRFIDVMAAISEFADEPMPQEIKTVYANKGYDAAYPTHLKTNHLDNI